MTDAEIQTLKTELESDPLGLGYAEHIAAGRHADIAMIGNARTGPGASAVLPPSIPREEFLSHCLPLSIRLATKDDATQRKWDRIIDLAKSKSEVQTNQAFTFLMEEAETDGLLTAEEAAGFGKRAGSRFEAILRVGVVVDPLDVSSALSAGGN